jgi:LacI family transcriptional regulator
VNLGSAARGRCAAELLLARLRDPDREVQRVGVEPELVVRSSTAVGRGPAIHKLRP